LFAAHVNAEELIPSGSKVIKPDGTTIILQEDSTIINGKEKEILVRNDELWQSDKDLINAQSSQISELNKKSELDGREIELRKQETNLANQRAEFYKEQLDYKSKIDQDAIDKLQQVIKETKPSVISNIVSKGGWVGLLVTIGIIIGIAL
jgi:hypothetical protein